jgi:hypothetical protein
VIKQKIGQFFIAVAMLAICLNLVNSAFNAELILSKSQAEFKLEKSDFQGPKIAATHSNQTDKEYNTDEFNTEETDVETVEFDKTNDLSIKNLIQYHNALSHYLTHQPKKGGDQSLVILFENFRI